MRVKRTGGSPVLFSHGEVAELKSHWTNIIPQLDISPENKHLVEERYFFGDSSVSATKLNYHTYLQFLEKFSFSFGKSKVWNLEFFFAAVAWHF